MTGNNEIIQKILADAKATSEKIVADAKVKADKIAADAKAFKDSIIGETTAAANAEVAEMLSRRQTVVDLDVKKQLLQMRKQLMDEVYAKALAKLKALPAKKYKDIITKMLKDNAEDGDTVTVSKNDKDVITPEFVAKVAKSLNVKLNYNKTFGDFCGGVILQSEAIDKNLSFEVELQALANEIEPQIAQILFD